MKININKLFSAGLAAALLLSCAACSSNDTETVSVFSEVSSALDETHSSVGSKSTAKAPDKDKCQKALNKIITDHGFEGVILISKDGEEICSSASGTLSSDYGSDGISIESQFCIASISKQFAATAVMQLQESGKLSVDDTLDKYFPEYRIGKDITIKNLLTMRSGIVDFYYVENEDGTTSSLDKENLPFEIYAQSDAYDNKLAIKEWLFNQPLNFEPDTNYEYSNSNYLILAEIVEQVSETDYHTYLKENILDPLGMEHTSFISDIKNSPVFAKSTGDPGVIAYPGVTEGAADIVSTAEDIDKWLTAFRTKMILSQASYDEMTANYSPENEQTGYGYGVMIGAGGGVMHPGSLLSYVSFAYTSPKTGFNVFFVTNDSDKMIGDWTEMFAEIRTEILR